MTHQQTYDCWCDVATVAWRCLTLENNGTRSWPYSRVWRVHKTRARVSNVAPYECDVTLTWVGSQEVCCLLHSPYTPLWDHELSVQLSRSNVIIKCVNTSCVHQEFISRLLARGIAALCLQQLQVSKSTAQKSRLLTQQKSISWYYRSTLEQNHL